MLVIIEHGPHENQYQFGSGSQRGGHGGSNDGVWIVCRGRMLLARMDILAASSSTPSMPERYGKGKMEMEDIPSTTLSYSGHQLTLTLRNSHSHPEAHSHARH